MELLFKMYESIPKGSSFRETTEKPEHASPSDDLLPKGMSFFRHSHAGVSYHGLACETSMDCMAADCEPKSPASPASPTLVHCAHGFGASSLSFANLMKAAKERPLKDGTPSAWVAHDVFGFGFTATDNCDKDEADPEADPVDSFKSLLPLESNGKAAVSICKSLAQGTEEPANAVFIGHSMGAISALCSASEWLETGHTVDGVVLIAPAINTATMKNPNPNNFTGALTPAVRSLFDVAKVFWGMVPAPVRRTSMASALKIGVSLDFFWNLGLRFALGWHQEPHPETVEQYKCPMTKADWAPWLVAFIEANVLRSPSDPVTEALPLQQKIQQLLDAQVKILVVHDPTDTFTPLNNSEDLAEAFDNKVLLEVVELDAGHLVHETDPGQLLDLLEKHGICV